MLYQGRTNLLFFYRLFFIALFLLLGIAGIGTVVLEYYFGIDIISTETAGDEQALYVTSSFMGVFGVVTALIMIYLMREKRGSTADRRQKSQPLTFTDRRSNIDRRSN